MVRALQAGDALVQMEAALGVGDSEHRHAAFLRARGKAFKRSKSVREGAHPLIIAAMRGYRDANARKKRPVSFSNAAKFVARKTMNPRKGKQYSIRWIMQIAKDNNVHW